MSQTPESTSLLNVAPIALLREAIRELPAMKYALGVGGIAAVVAIALTAWKLEPQTAIFGGLVVFIAMVALVIFSALSRTGPAPLRPLALFLGWSFLLITTSSAVLFVSCAFFDAPKKLQCLLKNVDCAVPPPPKVDPPIVKVITPPVPDYQTEVATAEAVLKDLYSGHYQKVYDRLSGNVQQSQSFMQFKEVVARQMVQVKGGPLDRKLKFTPHEEGGYLLVPFTAEFDEASTWIENVVFVKTPKGWELYHLDIEPFAWSEAGPNARVLTEADPAEALKDKNKTVVAGAWTPLRGWVAIVKKITSHKADKTCDMDLLSANTLVIARDVLGACSQEKGNRLQLLGRVKAIGPQTIELEQVRFQPSDL